MITRSLRLTLAALVMLASAPAVAQDIDPETGEVYIPPPEDGTQTQQTTTTEQPPQQTGTAPWYAGGATGQPPPEAPPDHSGAGDPRPSYQVTDHGGSEPGGSSGSAEDDHMRVVGNMGVGFMGMTLVPVGSPGTPVTMDTVSAPALGIRYWLGELIGLDVGIGLGYIGGTTTASRGMGADPSSFPDNNAFAMAFHVGVPLVLFHAEHYKFLIVPEVNLGFSTGTAFGGASTDDQGRNGIVFQLGGRVGTEIHFGFMDIPQLSLQASVGLFFEYRSAGLGDSESGTQLGGSRNVISLGTTVEGEPWDILLGALSALFYFE